jgi:hypothetical protein
MIHTDFLEYLRDVLAKLGRHLEEDEAVLLRKGRRRLHMS